MLINKLISLAKYVELTAGDNIEALRSSGFQVVEVEKVTQAPGVAGTPTILVNGVADMLIVRIPRDKHATLYELTIWGEDESKKLFFSSNTRDISATGLPAGEVLNFQARLANAVGKSPQSPTFKTRIPSSGELLPARK